MTFFTAQAAFYFMAAVSVVSAILAVTRKNPVHSMLWVLALFLHVAGIFLLLGAEFLAAVQVIVYAGAILVFYLFVLMLLDLPGELARPKFSSHWRLAAAAALVLVALICLAQFATPNAAANVAAIGSAVGPAVGPARGTLTAVGTELFGPLALPFEMASLVLLAAIVGAVVLARRRGES